MKKILILSSCILILVPLLSHAAEREHTWLTTDLSAGYVFKHDCRFKEVYGQGMVNIITADGCYYPWSFLGFGAKLSYWRAKGHTAFLQLRTHAQEVPFTVYVRGIKEFPCRFQLYGSLGAGLAWIKENSYLGDVHVTKGIGEIEVGFRYPFWRCLTIMSAFRYVFPPQSQKSHTIDVGGCDLRAGIGLTF